MAQSLSKLYIHLVFHIKTDSPIMREEDEEYLKLLELYDVKYDKDYVFRD